MVGGLTCPAPYGIFLVVVVLLLSCIRPFATPWSIALKSPLFMAFSRQEYWSGWPFPSAGDPPDPGMELISPANLLNCRQILYHWATREAQCRQHTRGHLVHREHTRKIWSNLPSSLHWQVDSQPPDHWGSPELEFLRMKGRKMTLKESWGMRETNTPPSTSQLWGTWNIRENIAFS